MSDRKAARGAQPGALWSYRQGTPRLPGWCAALLFCAVGFTVGIAGEARPVVLRGTDGVEAVFARIGQTYQWVEYRDPTANRVWPIRGARFSAQTAADNRAKFDETGFEQLTVKKQQVILATPLPKLGLDVRQVFTFCGDGRTLRIQTFLRSHGDDVLVQRVELLELEVAGEDFRLMGPEVVSSPVFGEFLFAGIEHPSALCQAKGETFALAQPLRLKVGRKWTALPAAILGSCRTSDRQAAGPEALRQAFLRYLDTVRVKPRDMHIHYNDWWTAPVPSSQEFVAHNLAELRRGLYEPTGFFFDSYALDAGWSNPKSAWEMDMKQFPERFTPIRATLEGMHSHLGLWISPSSMYSFALDNHWLQSAGYEVTPHPSLDLVACLAKGGKYQTAFKNAALALAKEARLAHMKFDGYVPRCDVPDHGHPTGIESYLPLAEGLMDVFDALRAQNPDIALEPTCFGYQPSPWWLMHVPFIIGPFGDDSPYGRCPAPDYLEAMTTAREIKNLRGRDAFLMPSAALQCFDLIVQCPGAFQNHATMAIGRGRWFISSYINPKFMDADAWRFFADLMKWARHNRNFLQEPVPIGGNPEKREAYGYAFQGGARQMCCLRNPWMEEASIALPSPFASVRNLEVRMLYPRRTVIARVTPNAPLPRLALGPYETAFVEVVPTDQPPLAPVTRSDPDVQWQPVKEAAIERTVFDPEPPPFGPSWSSPDGAQTERLTFTVEGRLTLRQPAGAQLCALCEGDPGVAENTCRITVDGQDVTVVVSKSNGAFGATGEGPLEHWVWFLAEVPTGEHTVRIEATGPALAVPTGVYLRGDVPAPPSAAPFDKGPAFPLYHADRIPWSRVLVPQATRQPDATHTRQAPRRILPINGVYLDALDWTEASAGWGKIQRNRSIMEKPMTLGGRTFSRGLGAHATSRILYLLPEGFVTFAATVGKDQEVSGGSVTFVIQADGREVFRSGIFRNDTPPQEISVPLAGARKLALIVEDAGDNIMADHADWADARLLK